MFEDSLVDSGQRRNAGRTQWMVAASVAVQAGVLAGFVVVPLMWPAVLPVVIAAPHVAQVVMPKPKVKVETPKPAETRVTNATALWVPERQPETVATVRGGGVIARGSLSSVGAEDAPMLAGGSGMGSLFAGGAGIGDIGSPMIRVTETALPKPAGPVRISSGVIAGLLLNKITPTYPAIAKAAHVQGTVVLSAVIDKNGRITGLQVVSGPEMLRSSAVEAVQMARYQPYKLNGAATEVVTTISVMFRMEG